MNQEKIGLYIKEKRKAKNLTQQELAEKLSVSYKTISKWECGKGLPDVSIMLDLCKELNISVNELLCGEDLNNSNYQEKAEENLVNVLNERKMNTKRMKNEIIIGVSSLLSILLYFVLLGFLDIDEHIKVILIIVGLILLIIIAISLCVMDNNIGYFECEHCKERFVPKTIDYIKAPHSLTTRRLKCPFCGKISYCRKKLSKKGE